MTAQIYNHPSAAGFAASGQATPDDGAAEAGGFGDYIAADKLLQAQATNLLHAWPQNYELRHRGLYHGNTANGFTRVCDAFHIVGEASDNRSDKTCKLVKFNDRRGKPKIVLVPMSAIHGAPNALAGMLSEAGLHCVAGKDEYDHLRKFMAKVKPKSVLQTVTRSGWHGGNYIRPNGEAFGEEKDTIVFRHGDAFGAPESAIETYGPKGTLVEWQEHVAKKAIGNNRLLLSISTAFAGVLLRIAEAESGGVHFKGKSSIGKTTLLKAAASVHGGPASVQTWNMTVNGLEIAASTACDGFLGLDEIKQAAASNLEPMVYMLGNGRGKTRMTKELALRDTLEWVTAIVSTGEFTVDEMMVRIGRKAPPGLSTRLVELSADAKAGLGVFDTIQGADSPQVFAEALTANAAKFSGTAGPAFIHRIAEAISTPEGVEAFRTALASRRDAFIKANVPPGSAEQVGRVAGRLGMIAAAGEVAALLGVVPWPAAEATRGASACFKTWLADRGGYGSGEEIDAIDRVRTFLQTHEDRFDQLVPAGSGSYRELTPDEKAEAERKERESCARAVAAKIGAALPPDYNAAEEEAKEDAGFTEGANGRTRDRAGYYRWVEDTGGRVKLFFIFPGVWRVEVCTGVDANQVAEALHKCGYLEPGESGRWDKKLRLRSRQPRFLWVSERLTLG
jgi:putative DNA primase/helicase